MRILAIPSERGQILSRYSGRRHNQRPDARLNFETIESRTLLSADPLGLSQALVPANYEFQPVVSAALEHAGSVAPDNRAAKPSPRGENDEIGKSTSSHAGGFRDDARSGPRDRLENARGGDPWTAPDLKTVQTGWQDRQPTFLATPLDTVTERTDRNFDYGLRIYLPVSTFAREMPAPSTSVFVTRTYSAARPALMSHAADAPVDPVMATELEATTTPGKGESVAQLRVEPLKTQLMTVAGPTSNVGAPSVTWISDTFQDDGLIAPPLHFNALASRGAPIRTWTEALSTVDTVTTASVAIIQAKTGIVNREGTTITERPAPARYPTVDMHTSRADGTARSDDALSTLGFTAVATRHEFDDFKLEFDIEDLGYPRPLLAADHTSDTSLHSLVAVTAIVSVAAAVHANDRRNRDSGSQKAAWPMGQTAI